MATKKKPAVGAASTSFDLRTAEGLVASLEALPTPVILADTAMRVVYANVSAVRALKGEDVLGVALEDLFEAAPRGNRARLKKVKGQATIAAVRHNGSIVGHAAHLVMGGGRDAPGSERLERLNEALLGFARGNLTTVVEVEGDDQLGRLEQAVAELQHYVITMSKKVVGTASLLASSSDGLGLISTEMTAASEQTASTATLAKSAAEEVQRAVETVATATEELSASINEIAHNAIDAAKVAERAVTVARGTTDTIGRLGTSSNEIGAVIKVITSIAQQTNLLALNATIEAARAGEVGKGFAVVANEVKELAKETARATEDISQRIESIQASTGQATAAIGEISTIIGQISEIQSTIASAVEQQSVTTGDIARNISEASRGVSGIAHNISTVADAAKQTAYGASQTQAAASEVQRVSNELLALSSGFSV